MRPSSRLAYALRALLDLAIRQSAGPVTVVSIARRQGIPVHSLEQLFNRLRRGGLVVAERGPRGGYRLAHHPKRISLKTIFQLTESLSNHPSKHATGRRAVKGRGRIGFSETASSNDDKDPAQLVWDEIQKAIESSLGSMNLADLLRMFQDKAGIPIHHRYTFHI
jgi:Rrf2 family protein